MLKSKWLTYIILQYKCDYLFEVVLLLRALNTQSRLFHGKLIDELRPMFKQALFIKIQPNLKFTATSRKEAKDEKQSQALESFAKL